MKRAALLFALVFASCDDFGDLLCQRTGCDGGTSGGDGGVDAGLDAGAGMDGGVDAGSADAGTDGGARDAGVPFGFGLVMRNPESSDNVPIVGFVAGYQYTLLAAANRAPMRTSISSLQTDPVDLYRPATVGQGETLVFFGSDGGVDSWHPDLGADGRLVTAQPLWISAVSGLPDAGVLAVGTTPAGDTAWSALSRPGPSNFTTLACPMRQVAIASTNREHVQHVVAVGASTCGTGADHLYAGRFVWNPPAALSLVDTGAQVLSGTAVRGATDFSEADFIWQDATGLRIARSTLGGPLVIAPAAVAPLSKTTPVASDLAVYNNTRGFVLVLSSASFGQEIHFSDGGVQPLEAGVPLVVFGAWDGDVPVVSGVRSLQLGHDIRDVRLAHSISEDQVYLAGLCRGALVGPSLLAPCEVPGARFFVLRVDPL